MPADQLILPTDKRNPCFSVYRSPQGLLLFYGLELFEVVPDMSDHPAFKMMVGRLYNAQVKSASLAAVFDLDPKTIRSWGLALRSADPAHLERVLLGRRAQQKRSRSLDNFVARRWPQLIRDGVFDYRATLAQEVSDIFGVTLSGETLRQIYQASMASEVSEVSEVSETTLTATQAAEVIPSGAEATELISPPLSVGSSQLSESALTPQTREVVGHLAETTCSEPPAPALERDPSLSAEPPSQAGLSPDEAAILAAFQQALSNPSAPNIPLLLSALNSAQPDEHPHQWAPQPGDTILCDHVGLLLFASSLGSIANATGSHEPLLRQWLASILLGALNIEQTKYLNHFDLRRLLGQVLRFTTPQRTELSRLASPATIDAVLRWNAQQLKLSAADTDFYYDPHTTHYTGMQSVLKGWCASIRWADKLINADYIHTAQAAPIYFECSDNYEDLRTRFVPLISRMRQSLQWPLERRLSFIVDRGIYSHQVLSDIAQDPSLDLITWEKGCQASSDAAWAAALIEHSASHGQHSQQRIRNNSRDLRTCHYSYLHQPWPKNNALRQIIVRATNPKGSTIELSILSTDTTRPSREIVHLMFMRWVQENDFKYLSKHFGINQLTSCRSTGYAELRDQLTDRQVPNRACIENLKRQRSLNAQKARLLLQAHKAQSQEEQRQERIAQLQSQPSAPAADHAIDKATDEQSRARGKELNQARNASNRHQRYQSERAAKLKEHDQALSDNEAARSGLAREVSRIDTLISAGMVRMEMGSKTLMDTLKMSARNLFCTLIAPFKAAYDNTRDDHDHYRALTQSNGVLRWTGEEIEVHLVPQINYSPQLRQVIEAHLSEQNQSQPKLPDGSGRALRLLLTKPEQIRVEILDQVSPNQAAPQPKPNDFWRN